HRVVDWAGRRAVPRRRLRLGRRGRTADHLRALISPFLNPERPPAEAAFFGFGGGRVRLAHFGQQISRGKRGEPPATVLSAAQRRTVRNFRTWPSQRQPRRHATPSSKPRLPRSIRKSSDPSATSLAASATRSN